MPEHPFELTIQGNLTDARADALFDAGCDDATFSGKGHSTFAAFDREAPSSFSTPSSRPSPTSSPSTASR